MSDEPIEFAEWPKGLYVIFVTEDNAYMGKVVGLTSTTAKIHPWDFMFGGVDEEQVREIVLADVKTFHAFDDIWDMDDYHEQNYWGKMTGEDK
jgi:hypothetical protein